MYFSYHVTSPPHPSIYTLVVQGFANIGYLNKIVSQW
jgi:hypothetical protein